MDLSHFQRVLARIEEIEGRFAFQRVIPSSERDTASLDDSSQESFENLVEEYARKYEMDPKLVKRLIQVESGFDAEAISPKGAMGLMQLMPETCNDLGVENPFDARENLEGGLRYLKGLIERFRDVKLALAAYNAGPGRVREYGGVPPFPETQQFVKKVLGG
ncbi:MAG: lytic transglycosylase domain-containing protein [Candidatus Atribacteria bacterium]|nr:lytic transglycosylase domain-containing protein [Candidatus Atribacteria bacterium]